MGTQQPAPRLLHLDPPLADDGARQTHTDTAQATLACAYHTWQECHDEDRQLPCRSPNPTLPYSYPISSKLHPQVDAYLDAAAERAALLGAPPAGQWQLPGVAHAPGFDLYTGADAAKHAHEAGCAGCPGRGPAATCTTPAALNQAVRERVVQWMKHWRRLSCQGRVCMDVLL